MFRRSQPGKSDDGFQRAPSFHTLDGAGLSTEGDGAGKKVGRNEKRMDFSNPEVEFVLKMSKDCRIHVANRIFAVVGSLPGTAVLPF
jgi:hypothetical protein